MLQREAKVLANQTAMLMIALQMATTRRDEDPSGLLFVAGLTLESVRRRCDEWMEDPAGYTGTATDAAETKAYKRPAREHVRDFAVQRLRED